MHVWAGVICGPLPLKVRYSSCASRRQETAPASYPPASRDAESSSHVRLVVFVPFSPVRSCDFVKETESHCSVGLGLAWPALPVAREPKKGGKGQHGDLVSFLGISQAAPNHTYVLSSSSQLIGYWDASLTCKNRVRTIEVCHLASIVKPQVAIGCPQERAVSSVPQGGVRPSRCQGRTPMVQR